MIAGENFPIQVACRVLGVYLEIWHNRKHRYSQLGWITSIEFERNRIITVA